MAMLLSEPVVVPHVDTLRLMLLTGGLFGLQGGWALLLGSGTPYLLGLGFSRAVTALIWLAGPLGGTFLQPCIGIFSDHLASRWGKRKPVIAVGVAGASLSLMSLALLPAIADRTYEWLFREHVTPHAVTQLSGALAIFWLCALNFSLQPVQVGLRALIVDLLPSHQQSLGSAWSGRFTALGSVITYFVSQAVISRYPESSFEILCAYTSVILILTTLPCLLLVKEPITVWDAPSVHWNTVLRRSLRAASRMPSAMRDICAVQFASWLGWFPFMYYNTTFVSSLSFDPAAGVKAYLLFSLVTLYFATIMPYVQSPTGAKGHAKGHRCGLSLRWLWLISQLLFAVCMLLMFTVSSGVIATALVAACGISWSLSLWVPLGMMSIEIAKLRSLAPPDGEVVQQQAGLWMSVYNIAISAPQIVAGCLSSAAFYMLEGVEEQRSLSWVLGLSGFAALASAALILRSKF